MKSLFFYGEANNMLEQFKHQKKGTSSLKNLSTFIVAFMLIVID